jgi:hypothetical protein
MTSPVFDFKSIRRSLERQEQKADFDGKNPKPISALVGGSCEGAPLATCRVVHVPAEINMNEHLAP